MKWLMNNFFHPFLNQMDQTAIIIISFSSGMVCSFFILLTGYCYRRRDQQAIDWVTSPVA